MSDFMRQPVLQVGGTAFSPATSGSDPTGLWGALPPLETAFDGAGERPPDLVWRAELPPDPSQADAGLRLAETRLTAAQRAVDASPARLAAFVAQAHAAADEGRSFALAATPLPLPERRLSALLAAAEGGAGPEAAYDLGLDLGQLQKALESMRTFVDRLRQSVTHYAWVETSQAGRLIARTVMSWKCDASTAWETEASPEQAELHLRTLALALRTRNTWLQMFVMAARGAVLLAGLPALLAAPGGALVALSAAMQYLSDLAQTAQPA